MPETSVLTNISESVCVNYVTNSNTDIIDIDTFSEMFVRALVSSIDCQQYRGNIGCALDPVWLTILANIGGMLDYNIAFYNKRLAPALECNIAIQCFSNVGAILPRL